MYCDFITMIACNNRQWMSHSNGRIYRLMAVGAIRAIQDHGLRVPQDIAVAGYDGIALGRYTVPRLTTIRQNTTVLAERAADILLRCIEENAPAAHEIVPFELVEGESV